MPKFNEDAYALWMDNAVTQSFMKDIDHQIKVLRESDRASGSTIEDIAMRAIETQAQIDLLLEIQKWRPEND